MNASEARQLTNEKLMTYPVIKETYEKTLKWIEWAARQGKSYIDVSKAIESTDTGVIQCVKYMLIAEGYIIRPHAELNDIFDYRECISW